MQSSKFTQKNKKAPSICTALPLMLDILEGETNVVLSCAFTETSSIENICWTKDNELIVIDGIEKKVTVKLINNKLIKKKLFIYF